MPPRRRTSGQAADSGSGSGSAPASRTYESTPVPRQLHFPARRRIVRTYGGRRSLPAALDAPASGLSESARRRLRQQTLTQAGYVRTEGAELLDEEEVVDGVAEGGRGVQGVGGVKEEEEEEGRRMTRAGSRRGQGRATTGGEKKGKRRRKTMGDAPTPNPASSFHTQTLTQFLGERAQSGDGLRIEDEDGNDQDRDVLGPPSSKTPTRQLRKRPSPSHTAEPHTPSSKRIKVNLDEVPSSQPTPFTPMLGYSPIRPARSPLKEKSTNVDAPPPTEETVSKRPRNLVIQDSYSQGSSPVLPAPSLSVPVETPRKERGKLKREPLAEIPVASLELGRSSAPAAGDIETPTRRRRNTPGTRGFVEIPDSDAELESNWSTPFKAVSVQQTPIKDIGDEAGFEIPSDPASGSGGRVACGSGTPAPTARRAGDESAPSTGKSNKENEPVDLGLRNDGEETASEEEAPGTPTPTTRKTSSQMGGASQGAGSLDSGPRKASSQTMGAEGKSANHAGSQPATSGEPVSEGKATTTPTPPSGKPRSQHRANSGKTDATSSKPAAELRDTEELTASEDEGHSTPTQILPKGRPQKASIMRKRNSTPEIVTSESSTGGRPSTPTPVARRVQIELPPAPSAVAEEVYKETPRKPAKFSSPIFQRHTQGRSQYYESQRVPMQVIRSLGPQTDRSDILVSIHPDIVDEIVAGRRDHEFRPYKFPVQVLRCWIYTTRPAGEVKYMATLGPAKEPGQIDNGSGFGNAEFNAGISKTGHTTNKYAHKLLQVYQLNNPVPLADMPDNGLGEGPPQKYRYIPPAIVGQLMANLRCALFEEEGEAEQCDGEGDGDGGATTSQELEEQLRSDIILSTQMGYPHEEEEEEVIPASPEGSVARRVTKRAEEVLFARPAVPPVRSSQRIREQNQNRAEQQARTQQPRKAIRPPNPVRPSQATTASDVSSSSIPSSPPGKSVAGPSPPSCGAASVPRPAQASFNEPSLPDLLDVMRDEEGDGGEGSLIRLPPVAVGSSSQAALLPPDSLLVDEVRQPPPVVIWDSEEEDGE